MIRSVWVQASYDLILGINGKLCKVVKFAADTTAQVEDRNPATRIAKVDRCRSCSDDRRGDLDVRVSEISSQAADALRISMQAVQQNECDRVRPCNCTISDV